jgi:hypothetical protein
MKLIFFAYTLFTSLSYAAPLPSKWRMQIDVGREKYTYEDDFQFQPFLNTQFESRNINLKLTTSYFLVPPFFYIEASGETSALQLESSNETVDVTRYEASVSAGLFFPGDFYWLKIVSENYFHSMIVSDKSFGYKNVENWVVYPIIGLNTNPLDDAWNLSIFYKYPIFKSSDQINETLIGAELRVPLGTKFKYPLYAYQKAMVFKLTYKKYEFRYLLTGRTLDMESRSIIYSVGYNF